VAEDFEIRLRLRDAAGALELLRHSARVDQHLRVAVQMVTEERGRLAELMAEAAADAVRMARGLRDKCRGGSACDGWCDDCLDAQPVLDRWEIPDA
jgi:hypothetical protein